MVLGGVTPISVPINVVTNLNSNELSMNDISFSYVTNGSTGSCSISMTNFVVRFGVIVPGIHVGAIVYTITNRPPSSSAAISAATSTQYTSAPEQNLERYTGVYSGNTLNYNNVEVAFSDTTLSAATNLVIGFPQITIKLSGSVVAIYQITETTIVPS